jgi:multidrug transporter EmrE-like cation transporter
MSRSLILLIIGGLILTVGDIVIKKWVQLSVWGYYALGMVAYIIALNFLAFSFKDKNIAVATMIFTVINVVTLSIFSWGYFKEPLSPIQIFGLALGLVSVAILELG